ncbi:MAG: shikimate dehydrogenase [Salinivirgaceae bacterium]|nr:MAG: shikimate dehydrogenase [Salinivirgaceae bacterium]
MKTLGLIGYPLSHSFSPEYFTKKFEKLGITGMEYKLFPLKTIKELPYLLEKEPNLIGFNVTIPYKKEILSYLDQIDTEAKAIGAVNTVTIKKNQLKGYNTDVYGFECTLDKLPTQPKSAIIFGNGGAAEAVKYALKKRNISYKIISRRSETYNYDWLSEERISSNKLLINTTPIGMYPNIESKLPIPEKGITPEHSMIDLIYNPEVTSFMQMGIDKGAFAINGQLMLEKQADKAWQIFNF